MRLAVPSTSHVGQFWFVTVSDDGKIYCDCPRSSFTKKGAESPCKHVVIAKSALAMIAKCAASHQMVGGLCPQCVTALIGVSWRKSAATAKAAERAGREKGKAIRRKRAAS